MLPSSLRWEHSIILGTIILGIDPGLAHTGWGVIESAGRSLRCVAYGCVATPAEHELSTRLHKIHGQIQAVIERYGPSCIGIESVLFGHNVTAAFKTGQARGAALVACAEGGLDVGEFTPSEIKMAVVGTGSADKHQVQYMVQQTLGLDEAPHPDHAADALAAAICYTTHLGNGRLADAIRHASSERSRDAARPVMETAC